MPELFQVVTVAEANARLAGRIGAITRVETLPLHEALDRVLAEDLRSPVDLPAFPRSTMDGFALRAADTYGASEGLPAYLTLCGEVPVGRTRAAGWPRPRRAHPHRRHAPARRRRGGDGRVHPAPRCWDDRGRAPGRRGRECHPTVGEDVRRGDLLFTRGHRLRPQDLGGLAGVSIVRLSAVARPRVAILASGDEVVPATVNMAPGRVRDIGNQRAVQVT